VRVWVHQLWRCWRLAAGAGLTVKGRAPTTGYRRDQFGQAWFDADHNGCDTRNDILRRDLHSRRLKNAARSWPAPVRPPPAASTYYANCTAVRAAGAAPIHRGDPGYASKLDRDGDGIGCE